MPLAASMDEPPPTATTAGRPPAATTAAAATSPVVGLGCTPLNTVTAMPPAASTPATLVTTTLPARFWSVTMTAVSLPVPRTAAAAPSIAPGPNCVGGMGVSTSLLRAMGLVMVGVLHHSLDARRHNADAGAGGGMDGMRVGIIGAGWIGAQHHRTLASIEGADVVAV